MGQQQQCKKITKDILFPLPLDPSCYNRPNSTATLSNPTPFLCASSWPFRTQAKRVQGWSIALGARQSVGREGKGRDSEMKWSVLFYRKGRKFILCFFNLIIFFKRRRREERRIYPATHLLPLGGRPSPYPLPYTPVSSKKKLKLKKI